MPEERPVVTLPLELDLLRLNRDALLRLFRGGRHGFNHALMYRTAILHHRSRVEAGLVRRPRRNLRALYYTLGRPLTVAAGEPHREPYETFLAAFTDLVTGGRLTYADLGITDELWENRRIGVAHPSVVVMTEKVGQIRLLREVHDALDVTIQAYAGNPSAVTSAYLATHVREAAGPGVSAFLAVVDLDPFGWEIALNVRAQLVQNGLDVPPPHLVVREQDVPPEVLAAHVYAPPVTRTDQPLVDRWLRATGGIGGRLAGIALEALPHETLRARLLAAVREALSP